MITWYLFMECIGVLAAAALWLITCCGLFRNLRWSQQIHGKVQYIWTNGVLLGVRVLLNGHINYPDCSLLGSGPMIIVAQHRSFFDACVPSVLIGKANGETILRHVLKSELILSPSLDLFGHRLPNYFVMRNSDVRGREMASIAGLASGLNQDACVIFPEGTFYSTHRFQRALTEIASSDSSRVSRVQNLKHVLPLRPGGILALLNSAPDADLVFIGHHGFDQFSSFRDILRNVPFSEPISITLKRITNSQLPQDDDERLIFLDHEWTEIDRWNEKMSIEHHS
tara:strand:+ start:938 stop:1786 length:849 start_codon:yes stop_codon:yes gene_type:complete